jgi:hypothetical protein
MGKALDRPRMPLMLTRPGMDITSNRSSNRRDSSETRQKIFAAVLIFVGEFIITVVQMLGQTAIGFSEVFSVVL